MKKEMLYLCCFFQPKNTIAKCKEVQSTKAKKFDQAQQYSNKYKPTLHFYSRVFQKIYCIWNLLIIFFSIVGTFIFAKIYKLKTANAQYNDSFKVMQMQHNYQYRNNEQPSPKLYRQQLIVMFNLKVKIFDLHQLKKLQCLMRRYLS